MILTDTSVWIDHFHKHNPRLSAALEAGLISTHPFVIGELSCGNIRNRREILSALASLPQSIVATDPEVLVFLERHKLAGRGLGYIDVNLLASAALTVDTLLWSRDKRLAAIAAQLELAHRE